MRDGCIGCALALLPHGFAAAQAPSCSSAGLDAEQASQVPKRLLVSIGMVESGRADPESGQRAPWPWTVNADGVGHFFDSKADAEAFVQAAQAGGAGDIDVGCFQVSLRYHPEAFATLDDAFDPASNAAYAAGFLTRLKAETGSWGAAVADYHSAVPALGLPYQQRVLAAWQGGGDSGTLLSEAATDEAADADAGVVVVLAPAARRVRVVTLAGAQAPARPGLPRVISP